MCTVTFIARQKGYCLGMNRDEKLTRVTGLPPMKKRVNGNEVICPSEPTGGTWIALNEAGVCFALINWYSVTDRVKNQPISRGEVVKIVSGATLPGLADEALNTLRFERLNPFRLIGIFPATNEILQWNWDRQRKIRKKLPWRSQQWISSGLNEPEAQRIRGATFRGLSARTSHDDGLGLVRKLHCSHTPTRGPFSTCVHREDAATVSYTEIAVNSVCGTMSYWAGAPCATLKTFRKRLVLSRLLGAITHGEK